MSDTLNRVFIWCVPRTVSTALLKCLSFVKGVQAILEPYEPCFYMGPDRQIQETDPEKLHRFERRSFEILDLSNIPEDAEGLPEDMCTYDWIQKDVLEAPYKDKEILICKDMAFFLDARYHNLPKGFKHSFLIRHPAKVLLSWKKAMVKMFGEDFVLEPDELLLQLPNTLFPAGNGYKELYELVEHVEKILNQEAVIVDADDLQSDPPGILSAYCHKMGIPYSPDLLSWDAGDAITKTWITSRASVNLNKSGEYLDIAYQSSCFIAPAPVPDFESLPPDVQTCVTSSMEYYEKLYKKRIQPCK